MSVMVNGVYWQPGCPRLLTNEDIQQLTKQKALHSVSDGCPPLPHRFLAVCDISADINVRIILLNTIQLNLEKNNQSDVVPGTGLKKGEYIALSRGW